MQNVEQIQAENNINNQQSGLGLEQEIEAAEQDNGLPGMEWDGYKWTAQCTNNTSAAEPTEVAAAEPTGATAATEPTEAAAVEPDMATLPDEAAVPDEALVIESDDELETPAPVIESESDEAIFDLPIESPSLTQELDTDPQDSGSESEFRGWTDEEEECWLVGWLGFPG